MARSRSSLRRRLPLWIAVIVAYAVLTFGALAYGVVRRETERVTWVRLRSAADRFAQLTGAAVQARVNALKTTARAPALAHFLATGQDSAAAQAVLATLGPDTGLALGVGLRRSDGTPALVLRRALPALPAPGPPDSAGTSPIFIHRGVAMYESRAPVYSGTAVVGQLVVDRGLIATSASVRILNELVGPNGRLLIGNADGSQWTDLQQALGARQIARGNSYLDGFGDQRYMANAAAIQGTPFTLAVALPADQASRILDSLVWTLVGLAILVAAGAAIAGWLVIRRITSPLVDLTAAAEAVAAGERREPLTTDRDDEVGRLSEAFSVMSGKVADAREHLEQQVSERTAELERTQHELIQRERMAVLGQLASSVGHELRNPLGVMSNIAYYLNATLTDIPARARDQLAMLTRQVGLADKIVSDILGFTRLKEPEVRAVPVAAFVDDQLQRVSVPPTVRVERRIAPEVAQMSADPVQAGQVLFNVLTNAIQAMEGRGGLLNVRAHNDNGCVHIEVSDEGPGIPPQDRERVFEPLYTTKLRGIGLGLSVSRSLARANGGDLVVAESDARGTTFRLQLPAEKAN